MRNKLNYEKASPSVRHGVRLAVSLLFSTVLFVFSPGMASAASSPGSSTETFGLLGPVGIVAVSLGVLGMAAGVLRRRKRVAAEAALAANSVGPSELAPPAAGLPVLAASTVEPPLPRRGNQESSALVALTPPQ